MGGELSDPSYKHNSVGSGTSDTATYVAAFNAVAYAPDYVVNAGGIINVAAEHLGWTAAEAAARVDATGHRLAAVLDHADREGLAPHRAADGLARERIAGPRLMCAT